MLALKETFSKGPPLVPGDFLIVIRECGSIEELHWNHRQYRL
jgi:hypothetical protein